MCICFPNFDQSYTTGAPSGAAIAYLSVAHQFTLSARLPFTVFDSPFSIFTFFFVFISEHVQHYMIQEFFTTLYLHFSCDFRKIANTYLMILLSKAVRYKNSNNTNLKFKQKKRNKTLETQPFLLTSSNSCFMLILLFSIFQKGHYFLLETKEQLQNQKNYGLKI